jgi:PAS domain S-box-containing protein
VLPHSDSPRPIDDQSRIRVLHVDDEPEFAETAAAFIEREDDRLAVETAGSAEEGLARLADEAFDCVVSDYDMPGRNGIEFLDAVRADHPDLPFVLFTGTGSEEVASEAISAGVTDYLQKERGTDQYAILANRIANVVEGHRSRRGLEARKRRLETLISNLPGIVYRCRNEPEWPMEVVEGECVELTGYPVGALERGEVVWGEDVLHPDDRAEIWETVQDALATGNSFEVTYRIHTRDGTVRWMWERGRAVDATDREPEALEGFITDITGRKRREADLERANALLSTLFDALPPGVLAEDADREIMTANERLLELFDLPGTPDDVVGSDCARLAAAVSDAFADPAEFVDRIDELVAERSPAEEELELADGRTFERTYRPLELPDGAGNLWVYRDVTDRTERERKLQRLRDRTQALMYTDTVTETARVATDAADEVIDAPLSGVHLLGDDGETLEPTAVVEGLGEVLDGVPRYRQDAEPGSGSALVWDAFERGEPVRIDDTHGHESLTGEPVARSVIVHPVGRHGVFIVSSPDPGAFDDTDEALVELLTTSLRTGLDRVEREAELRRQRNELRRRNERLDEFTSVVSHDLRNPLSVARGRLDLAREDRDDEHLEAVARAHDRMGALIEDLLALAREGESITDTAPVDLASLVEDCWRNVETADAAVVVETDRTVPADRSRLQQLLANLFRNSVEHSSTGSRTPSGDSVEHSSTGSRPEADDAVEHGSTSDDRVDEDAGVTVTVGDLPDGFYVADDGPGIPPDEGEAVFETGYSTAEGGTGFGLAIVRRIAEAHGWDVAVTGSADGGARIEITGVDDERRGATDGDRGA